MQAAAAGLPRSGSFSPHHQSKGAPCPSGRLPMPINLLFLAAFARYHSRCQASSVDVRNKFAIKKKLISNPTDIIYKIIIFLQLWSLKAKAREKEGLSWMASELRELYVQLKPPAL
jgi:hypothetical protein